jgi:CRP/FNR family cyclic AMP-dependent transcriptional regulator
MALVDASARSPTAVVPVAATVARISRREFTYLVQEHPTFALQVMGVLADRLRRVNETSERPA